MKMIMVTISSISVRIYALNTDLTTRQQESINKKTSKSQDIRKVLDFIVMIENHYKHTPFKCTIILRHIHNIRSQTSNNYGGVIPV